MNAAPALVTLLLLCACTKDVAPQTAAKDAAPAKAEPAAPLAAAAEPDKPEIPELTEEDQRLIAADPKTLSPDDRRKRAFALRRKIMQNPDSESAKMLEDLRRAAEAGEIEPPTLHLEQRTAPAGRTKSADTKSADAAPTDESKSKGP